MFSVERFLFVVASVVLKCLVNLRNFLDAYNPIDAPRFFCSPSSPYRIFAARWRDSNERADEKGAGIQDAGGGGDRSRKPFRRDRILSGSEEYRRETDHLLPSPHRAALPQRTL